MIFEPTTLAAAARVIAETLENHYALDPEKVFRAANLDIGQLDDPESRYPAKNMQLLWRKAVEMTGDPCFGLFAGRRCRVTSFHALSFSWIASETLRGSLQRLCRYHQVITTMPLHLNLIEHADHYELIIDYKGAVPEIASIDAFVAAIIQLCRTATNSNFAPISIALKRSDRGSLGTYVEVLGCPVTVGADHISINFDRESLEARLPGNNLELAKANDSVLEKYLAALDERSVASEVRELLVTLLPSGKSSQDRIARRMHRSLSTLQRQLQHEGTSYQEIKDETRQKLAEDYVQESKLSLSQIAYMLGFSDQSNFSRAFKRWTGVTPKDYRT
ncbi:MAG: AraC family transcriptional regulator [Gammaproteobacteria bacterium]|nr:AraC family transcriptional regulator [Gammaproteobacteria bacterium]